MNNAVLNVGLWENRIDCLRESAEIIGAGNENIFNAPVFHAVKHICPELCTLVLANPHTKNVFLAVQTDPYCDVHSFLDDLSFAADMIVDRVHKYDRINALQRSLLPLTHDWQYLIRHTTYGTVRD